MVQEIVWGRSCLDFEHWGGNFFLPQASDISVSDPSFCLNVAEACLAASTTFLSENTYFPIQDRKVLGVLEEEM